MKFKIKKLNEISNQNIEWNLKSKNWMKFQIKTLNEIISRINKTALYHAVEKENIEIIQLLLSNDKIDVNVLNISSIIFIKFKIKTLNYI